MPAAAVLIVIGASAAVAEVVIRYGTVGALLALVLALPALAIIEIGGKSRTLSDTRDRGACALPDRHKPEATKQQPGVSHSTAAENAPFTPVSLSTRRHA